MAPNIINPFSLRFYEEDYEQKYQAYTIKFTMRNFTYFFLYSALAITIAMIKNSISSNFSQQILNFLRFILISLYYGVSRYYGSKNKVILDLCLITLVVSLYMLHLIYFFPVIFETLPGVNAYYLGSAIECLRIFLFTSKADWKLVVLGNIAMNAFNAYECLLIPKITKDNFFSFLFPFLMVNTFPIFSYFYERNLRQIFYENMTYQKTLENYEYLIKYAFPNPIIIINEEKKGLLFSNNAAQDFFTTNNPEKIFEKIKQIKLQFNQANSPNSEIFNENNSNPTISKDLYSAIHNFENSFINFNKFNSYDGFMMAKSSDNNFNSIQKDIYSEISLEIKMGKIKWRKENALLLILTDSSPIKLIQKLKEVDSYKDMLLATVSHDLRTPLNCIMGMLELVYEQTYDKKNKKYLKMGMRSGHLLLYMINDILDYSQITNNKFSLNNRYHELGSIVGDVTDLIKFQCRKKSIAFLLDASENTLKMKFYIDQLRLKQILLNLLGNALKFTYSGYVKLKITIITHKTLKRYFFFQVEDTGIGIKKSNIPKLFHLFGKMPQTNSEINATGVGLGLVISNHLAELLCSDELGGISVKSEYGRGSVFSFHIPLDSEETDVGYEDDGISEKMKLNPSVYNCVNLKEVDKRCSSSSINLPHFGSCFSIFSYNQKKKKKNILIVDDDLTNIFVIKQYLDKFDLSYETACNGREAIQQIIVKKNFDLILMDCNMPIMNGFECSKKIQKMIQNKEIPNIPIAALTANASIKDVEDCKKAGMGFYLSKPVSKKNFKEMLSKIFNMTIEETLRPKDSLI